MAMKHMTDTAFSKVIYDKSKIPEWSNEVGEAIGAVGGGNMAGAILNGVVATVIVVVGVILGVVSESASNLFWTFFSLSLITLLLRNF